MADPLHGLDPEEISTTCPSPLQSLRSYQASLAAIIREIYCQCKEKSKLAHGTVNAAKNCQIPIASLVG
jgi:hypothetical protein